MQREKGRIELTLSSGVTSSSVAVLPGAGWFVIELPEADKAKAVTIQHRSKVTGDWRNVVTLEDTTNAYKPMTALEIAAVGCLDEIRLVLGSGAAANSSAYIYWCS